MKIKGRLIRLKDSYFTLRIDESQYKMLNINTVYDYIPIVNTLKVNDDYFGIQNKVILIGYGDIKKHSKIMCCTPVEYMEEFLDKAVCVDINSKIQIKKEKTPFGTVIKKRSLYYNATNIYKE